MEWKKDLMVTMIALLCIVGVQAMITGNVTELYPGEQGLFQVHLDAPYNVSFDYTSGMAYTRWCGVGFVTNESKVLQGNDLVQCENAFDKNITVTMPADARKSYAVVAVMVETKQYVSVDTWYTEYENKLIANDTYQVTLKHVWAPITPNAPTLSSVMSGLWGWIKSLFSWI